MAHWWDSIHQVPGTKTNTVQQWDREWRSIGTLASLSLTPYNKSVGLYRAKFHQVPGTKTISYIRILL